MNLLEHRSGRTLLFGMLYVSEGAPIGFIWFALPTLLRQEGLPLNTITALTSTLILPWVFKFLWAPLVDTWRSPRFGFRGWIMGAQLTMGLALIPLIGHNPADHLLLWQILLGVHAMAAATQDVAVDALAVRSVAEHERGSIHGCMQAGMLLGRSLVAGGALWLWSRWGQSAVLVALIALTWSSLLLLPWIREPNGRSTLPQTKAWHTFRLHLGAAFRHRSMWLGLLFALTGAAGFELVGALSGALLHDLGTPSDTIGAFFAFGTVSATLLGGLIGGPVSDRVGRIRAVSLFLVGFVVLVGGLAWVDWQVDAPSGTLVMSLLFAMYVFVGLFTASSYALFMDLTDPKLGATQFSTFMAATNGCESWSVQFGGLIVHRTSYAVGFAVMGLVSLASLIVLKELRHQVSQESNPQNRENVSV